MMCPHIPGYGIKSEQKGLNKVVGGNVSRQKGGRSIPSKHEDAMR
jgi:hypothetical protein